MFFGANNPFSTPVGKRIEQATDGNLPSENWALNMEICDIINETEEGSRDAIKAIKRRLNQTAGKNYTVVMYTLTVLETCVKNCGKRFHTLACSREFIQELIALIGPKNEPPTVVQEKVLSLIQTWADTFKHQPHAQGVVQGYQMLKTKGIQFPMTDLDAMAPIITPERSVPKSDDSSASAVEQVSGSPATAAGQPQQMSAAGSNQLTEPQMAKLQSELDVVQGNMRVLAEMLAFLTNPDQSKPDPADLELLTELHATCKSMQDRVVELIGKLAHDEMTAELLRINDELNNLFLRYSRFNKNKNPPSTILAQTIGHPSNMLAGAVAGATSGSARDVGDSLIDLSDGVEGLDKQMAGLSTGEPSEKAKGSRKEGDSDEFDMFAQSRNATYESSKNGSSKYEDNIDPQVRSSGLSTALINRSRHLSSQQTASSTVNTTQNRESEFNEMAAWLDRTPGGSGHGDQESLTSSEFDRFLAERAAAAEALPTVATSNGSSNASSNVQRPMSKDQDKSLFAL